ncbi:MAG: ABC transporter permease [Clostridiales Family XIII bacterium]|jgi:ABC-type antimicrobial peptide transport system permease subunit|nr:ABC transporter permease [Clostridiales Family XIII bacterium]
MRSIDLFRFSTDNLRRRKGRTVLTVIGVVVGVCAIVVMVSLGIAVNRATDEMLQGWGDLTKIEVMRYGAQQGTPDLDDRMVAQFRQIPHVVAATPMVQSSEFYGQIEGGRNGRYLSEGAMLIGMDPDAIAPMGYELLTGGYDISSFLGKDSIPVLIGEQVPFTFRDTRKSPMAPNAMMYPEYDETYTNIINLPQYDADGTLLNPDDFFFDVMGADLVFRMDVGWDDATGETKYKDYKLVPVGMVKGGMSDWMVSNGVIMSLENMKRLESDHRRATGAGSSSSGGGYGMYGGSVVIGGGGGESQVTVEGYDTVYVKVDEVAQMPDVEKRIKETGYQIYSMSETRAQLQQQVLQTQLMLGGLAAVSLFVAALNIMNTMTMAITERTREIGVMKVLGCRLRDIRLLFLLESGAIGFLGGVAGVAVSLLLSFLLNHLTDILMFLGVGANIDLAAAFGLGGLSSMMPGMKLSVIPVWLILAALAFATGVGLLSGIAPAGRAVRISSLEAIRHE